MGPSLGLDPFSIPRKHGRLLWLTLGSQVLEGLSGEAGERRHHELSRGVEGRPTEGPALGGGAGDRVRHREVP